MSKFTDSITDLGFGTAGSLLQTGLGLATSKYYSDLQYQNNKKLADDAYQRQLDFWNIQNTYNNPSAQMERLRKAGLNPALMNGGVDSNVAGDLSNVPTPSVSQSSGNQPDNPASKVLSIAQYANILEQTNMLSEQTRYWMQTVINAELENVLKNLVGKDEWLRIKDQARSMGYDIPDSEKYDELFGVGATPSPDGASPAQISAELGKSTTKSHLASAEQSRYQSQYLQALTTTENVLRSMSFEQMKQNIAESKARVKQLSAESRKLLADAVNAEMLAERNEIVDAASKFYGFRVDTLPALVQFEALDAFSSVLRGELQPYRAYQVVYEYAGRYEAKETHIPRTRSETVSKNKSAGGLGFSHGTATSSSWLETY